MLFVPASGGLPGLAVEQQAIAGTVGPRQCAPEGASLAPPASVAALAAASAAAAVLRPAGGARRRAERRARRGGGVRLRAAGAAQDAEEPGEVARRGLLATAGGAAVTFGADAYLRASDDKYAAFGTILAPAPYKETLRTELVPGQIWGFEQCIALFSVSTNIRMTVVRLRDGTLWVSAPISPTRQLLRELDELGEVSHIVVPSSAYEHKASMAEFARLYPRAALWVAPGQDSTPLVSLPAGAKILGQGPDPPWAEELPYKVFYVAPPVTEPFAEVAFLHRASSTLLVTDCALKLSQTAPKILESYGYDGTPGPISPEQWRYKAIAFDFVTARGCDEADFDALARPPAIVNPLLRFLVYRRCPEQIRAWVEDVARWPFVRIVPAHLQAPFECTPEQFLDAFGFLFGKGSSWEPEDEQLAFLRALREQVGGPEF